MTAPKRRLSAAARRQQLLDVTARLLAEGGIDNVRVPDVAEAAGVTRPIVYKHFENRQALILGVLEDFGADLEARFSAGFRRIPEDLEEIARIFIDSVCDAIEAKSPRAWYLLDEGGPDEEIRRVIDTMRSRLTDPWLERVMEVTGLPRSDARAVAHMLVAASRAVLSLWIDREIDRQEAIAALGRGTAALLRELSRPSA